MTGKLWKLGTTSLATAGFVVAAAGSAMAQDTTLRVVHLAGEDDEDYDGALVLENYIEQRSDNVSVEVYPGGQLCGGPEECFDAIQANTIQVFISTAGGFANIFPEVQATDLPYKLRSTQVAECVYDDDQFIDYFRDAVLERTGNVRLMTVGNTGGWRGFFTADRHITEPSDLEGMDIRTINSELQQELVRLMGGNPTAIDWPELYTSFATGVVQGSKNSITDIVNMDFHEHIKHLTLDNHAYMAAFWMMNNDTFQSLSEEDQRIVQEGFWELQSVTRAMPKRDQISAYQEFQEAGGSVYVLNNEELAEFQEVAAPLEDWYVDQYGDSGQEFLNRFDAAIDRCESQVESSLDTALQ